jgi:hypothetical protein
LIEKRLLNKILPSIRQSAHPRLLDPITHPSTIAGEALSKIIEAIISGESKPGERISDTEIARQRGLAADLSGRR